MKRIMMLLLSVLLVFIAVACRNVIMEKEVDHIINENEEISDSEEAADDTNYTKISAYLEEESRKAFSPYYELLGFEISEYKEEAVNGNVEATFFYKLIHKNYDIDPDTVEYIKEAKESGNKNYQIMHDEYLQPKDMNFDFKVIIDEKGLITLYSNVSPKGIVWEETKMTDFIIK